jgi:AGZA family xanthine/uracil permease-like MFS transporter
MTFAWHVGAVVLVLIGLLKTVLAPVGNAVRRWVPRAGLLGSLAAIALALIAFVPLLDKIAAVPVVGFVALTVIFVTLVARRQLPGGFPGALAAVLVGGGLYALLLRFELAPKLHGADIDAAPLTPLPAEVWQFAWWEHVLMTALAKLPVMLPFALATVVGGIDCTESAAAVGDEYDTRAILLTEGLASVVAGLCGGVIQNTPYIGHPAYKSMGGRSAYTLATAVFIGLAGCFGWFTYVFMVLPEAAIFPILVYVGIEITGASFHATPERHYPAIALAILPALAALALIPVGAVHGPGEPASPRGAEMLQTLRCLANGFIVTSLLWGAALAELIDGRLLRSATYLLVAAGFSLVGIIHSPFRDAVISWPWQVVAELNGAARYQTPYHWAAAYGLAAALLLVLALVPEGSRDIEEKEA